MKRVMVGLLGAGGFAREVMPLLREQLQRELGQVEGVEYSICFVETNPTSDTVNGHPVISEEAFVKARCDELRFNVAIGDSRVRQAVAERVMAAGAKALEIRAVDTLVYDANQIGEGGILCARSMITSNAMIGRFFHANLFSYVAHDCVIGDYVTFAPNVHCNGNVHIGDHAYIGTGAVLKQGSRELPLRIGEGAVVGMGAVVTKSVDPFTTVVGNPARPIDSRPARKHES